MAVGVDNVEKADNVGIIHFFEKGDLADGCARNAFIFSLKTNFFQSDDSAGMRQVASLVDDTVCTYKSQLAKVVQLNQLCTWECEKKSHEKRRRLTFSNLLYLLIVLHLERPLTWISFPELMFCTPPGDE